MPAPPLPLESIEMIFHHVSVQHPTAFFATFPIRPFSPDVARQMAWLGLKKIPITIYRGARIGTLVS